ncbi:MAG: hypothetical protein HYZ26_13650 [Chloroflexi bacterium]|nr:hypothetical protein [Chloroflexota bacterium]
MRRIILFVSLLALLAAPMPARADVAPPGQPPGSNPQPGDELTQVRMAAETVVIEVLADALQGSLGRAGVTADFTMHNEGAQAEVMAVRFPIAANSGFSTYPEILGLMVVVDGSNVPIRRTTGPDPVYGGADVPWAEFDVTFPPGEDVSIRVTYMLEGTGEYPFIAFYYILATGAGWKDSIGRADLVLRLPYEASPHNVVFETEIGWANTTPGGVMEGREVRWHFEDLEPTQADDLVVALVMPSVWQRVLAERANVAANPDDGEAWGRLGKLYKEVTFLRRDYRRDAGGLELYALSVEAYEKAVILLPNDALWHAGFADLLAFHALYTAYAGSDVTAEAVRAMQEIQAALALKPNDPKVREIADEIFWTFNGHPFEGAVREEGGEYVFLWLTATPTPRPTATPESPSPTPAVEPTTAHTPTRTSAPPAPSPAAPSSGLPLCGAALLPLALLAARRRRR